MPPGQPIHCIERTCHRKAVPGTRRCAVCGAYWRGRKRAKRDWERLYVQPDRANPPPGEDEEIAQREAIHARRGRLLRGVLGETGL